MNRIVAAGLLSGFKELRYLDLSVNRMVSIKGLFDFQNLLLAQPLVQILLHREVP